MRNRSVRRTLLAAALLGGAMAGCGGNSTSSTSGNDFTHDGTAPPLRDATGADGSATIAPSQKPSGGPASTASKPPPADSTSPKADSGSASPAGTPANSAPPGAGATVAIVNGRRIPEAELDKVLRDAFGLSVLFEIGELELAKQQAENQHIVVTPKDIADEKEITLKLAFPDSDPKDYPVLLEQLLARQNVKPAQFDLLMETNAYVRKLVEPTVDKQKIDDEKLLALYNLQYGEQVKVHMMVVSNISKFQEAKGRVEAGESFEKVTDDLSVDPRNRELHGEVEPFTMQSMRFPEVLKKAAFDLKHAGQLSDAIEVDNRYVLIQLDKRIPPNSKVAPFAKVKEALTRQFREGMIRGGIQQIRNQLAQEVLSPSVTQIVDPELQRQYVIQMKNAKALQDAQDLRRHVLHPATRQGPPLPSTQPTKVNP